MAEFACQDVSSISSNCQCLLDRNHPTAYILNRPQNRIDSAGSSPKRDHANLTVFLWPFTDCGNCGSCMQIFGVDLGAVFCNAGRGEPELWPRGFIPKSPANWSFLSAPQPSRPGHRSTLGASVLALPNLRPSIAGSVAGTRTIFAVTWRAWKSIPAGIAFLGSTPTAWN